MKLAHNIEGLFFGAVVFAVCLMQWNHPLIGIIAGALVWMFYSTYKDVRGEAKAEKAHRAEVIADERLRAKVRADMASEQNPPKLHSVD